MGFRGFPPEAFSFYAGLEADNTKAYWTANKATFEAAVRGPMEALVAELEAYGPFHLFRPYNDVRFAKVKVPYKTHQGAVSEQEGGSIVYVHLSAAGLMAAAGYYAMASDQLVRFRAAVDDEALGTDLEGRASALVRKGYELGAIGELKTAPRGYPRDHPRVSFLRRKGLIVSRSFAPAAWVHTAKAAARVREVWDAAEPVTSWLDAQVGPSELPPDDRW